MPVPKSILRLLIESVRIVAPNVTDATGKSLDHLPGDDHFMESMELTNGLNLDRTISLIRKYFYDEFYSIGRSTNQIPPRELVGGMIEPGSDSFPVPAANSFDAGWYQIGTPSVGAFVLLQKQNVRLLPVPGRFVLKHDASAGQCRVLFLEQKTETKGLLSGWKYYYSRSPVPDELQEVRFYFNLNLAYAERWAYCLKERLDAYNLPFRLKYWNSAAPVPPRRDTGVLYVSAEHYVPTVFALLELQPEFRPLLFKGTPLFVHEFLLPKDSPLGIGFAESPLPDPKWGQMSFGESRCHQVAIAIVQAWVDRKDGDVSADGTVNFKRVIGILNAPPGKGPFFLNPNTRYSYDLDLDLLATEVDFPLFPTDVVLSEAAQIGFILCREAVWLKKGKGDTCTWIGLDTQSVLPGTQNQVFLNGLIGNGLERTSREWVAEFLEKLYEAFPHPLFEHTAAAARRGPFEAATPIAQPSNATNPIVGKESRLYEELRKMLLAPPAASRLLRLQRLKRLFESDRRPNTIHVDDWAIVNKKPRSKGWYDLLPSLDGLALLGFSYLFTYDPKLVPDEVRKAVAG